MNINIGIAKQISGIQPRVIIANKMVIRIIITRTIIITTTMIIMPMRIGAPRWIAICRILIGPCWAFLNTSHTVIGLVNSLNMKECAFGPRMNIPL